MRWVHGWDYDSCSCRLSRGWRGTLSLGAPAPGAARVGGGGRAEALAQLAAEEEADLIVLGSRPGGLGCRSLRCALARELEAATPVPVRVAPPATRNRSGHRLPVALDVATR